MIQAGDLANRNPLRTTIEASRHGMALPCYADEPRDLAALLEQVLRSEGLGIERDAREAMVASLGADRALSMREIEKLALYARGGTTVTLAHVQATSSDAASVALDPVIDGAFTGDGRGSDAGLQRLLAEGEDAGVIAGAVLRHACLLHKLRVAVDGGRSIDDAVESARVFFKRKPSFARQLALWNAPALETAIDLLRETQATARKQPRLSESMLSRALLQIASRANRR